MIDFVQSTFADDSEWSAEQRAAVVEALAAESQEAATVEKFDAQLKQQIELGRTLIADENRCAMCHAYRGVGDDSADGPDLTGYGSREWLLAFVANPAHDRFYGEANDRMPSFHKNPESANDNRLSRQELELVVDWLSRRWN
jgi:ubiquinol-cytochrome c reductase cytochrome b subunit